MVSLCSCTCVYIVVTSWRQEIYASSSEAKIWGFAGVIADLLFSGWEETQTTNGDHYLPGRNVGYSRQPSKIQTIEYEIHCHYTGKFIIISFIETYEFTFPVFESRIFLAVQTMELRDENISAEYRPIIKKGSMLHVMLHEVTCPLLMLCHLHSTFLTLIDTVIIM